MDIIICLLAIFGLAFAIKEADGPWDIMSRLRNKLITNKYVGVFFFHLLECYFCVGFHCGWIVYLLYSKNWAWNLFILWGLAGSAWSLIMHLLLARVTKE